MVAGGSYASAEKQSVYSTAPADWATIICFHTVKWYEVLLLTLIIILLLLYESFSPPTLANGFSLEFE